MRPVRIAQIGTSAYSHGDGIFKTLKKLPEDFEIAGVALPEGEREKFPDRMPTFDLFREMTVDEILSDPSIDAVAVETEEVYLTRYALAVARAGKHIHMEKPGSQSRADFKQLIETVRQNKTVFHIGYMYRYNPMIRELFEEIDRGELGQIVSVQAQMSGDQPPELRQWLTNFRGGEMFYLGCHLVDLVYRILGQPEKVIPLNTRTGLDGTAGEDLALAVLTYKNALATVRSDANQRGGYPLRELAVTGSKKTVVLCPLEMRCPGGQNTTRRDLTSDDWFDLGTCRTGEPMHRYRGMMQAFAAMCRGELENPYSLDYEQALFDLILDCCGVEGGNA